MRKNNKYLNCHLSFSQENVKGASNYKIIKSGRSLDLAYQLGAMTMVGLFSFNAYAECTPTPDCASIGYTETSCEGASLKCPFDISKLFCVPCDSSFKYDCSGDNIVGGIGSVCGGKYVACECSSTDYVFDNGQCVCDPSCKVGAIYYSDGTCSACVVSGKTAIGIVVKDNKLVMSQIRSTGMQWGTQGTDIPDLINRSQAEVQADYNGKENTAILVAFQTAEGKTASNSAAINCYEYSTEGTSVGNWYLPAAGELHSYVYGNYNKLSNIWINKLVWNNSFSYTFWSSSECDRNYAWGVRVNIDAIGTRTKNYTHSTICFLAID